MSRNPKLNYLCLLTFVFLYSCTSIRNIGIEVAVSPEYLIGEDIQSLVLLNKSIVDQFSDNKIDSLEKISIFHKEIENAVFQDSIAADTAIQVAARALYESGRFDVVVPKDRTVFRTYRNENVKPMTATFINEVCRDFNVDALLVLEVFTEQLDTKCNVLSTVEYNASTDISYNSVWRLYRSGNPKPVVRFQVSDTIFWEANGITLEKLFSKMPRIKEALTGGGIASGLKMSKYISPAWVNQIRYYYTTGKNEVDAAIPLIKNNKWEEAAAIWAKYEPEYSGTIKSKIEFNLALAAEMTGDIDLAIEWGIKSYKARYTRTIEVYLKSLEKIKTVKQKEIIKSY